MNVNTMCVRWKSGTYLWNRVEDIFATVIATYDRGSWHFLSDFLQKHLFDYWMCLLKRRRISQVNKKHTLSTPLNRFTFHRFFYQEGHYQSNSSWSRIHPISTTIKFRFQTHFHFSINYSLHRCVGWVHFCQLKCGETDWLIITLQKGRRRAISAIYKSVHKSMTI